MTTSPAPNLNRLFLRTIPDSPLRAELFQYVLAGDGVRTLELRYVISRDDLGSVYMGICEGTPPFGDPAPPFAAAFVWDVKARQIKIRVRDREEQIEDAADAVFPAGPGLNVPLSSSKPLQTHLGYKIYAVEGHNYLWYCPLLSMAMIEKNSPDNPDREFVVQSVIQGNPDLGDYTLA